jgi:RimJ/RimL family protein N-acetyltransferase
MIQTPRLLIRPVLLDDCDALYTYRSDSETNQFLSLIPQDVEDIRQFILRSSPEINIPNTWFQLAIVLKESGTVIGDVGIHFLGSGSGSDSDSGSGSGAGAGANSESDSGANSESDSGSGTSGSSDSDSENKQAELGYTLHKDFRGMGYATEAISAIIDHLIFDLKKHRTTASIDPRNANSIRLIERLGFSKEAHFKQSLFFHGEWVDDLIYAMLAKEWKIKKANLTNG